MRSSTCGLQLVEVAKKITLTWRIVWKSVSLHHPELLFFRSLSLMASKALIVWVFNPKSLMSAKWGEDQYNHEVWVDVEVSLWLELEEIRPTTSSKYTYGLKSKMVFNVSFLSSNLKVRYSLWVLIQKGWEYKSPQQSGLVQFQKKSLIFSILSVNYNFHILIKSFERHRNWWLNQYGMDMKWLISEVVFKRTLRWNYWNLHLITQKVDKSYSWILHIPATQTTQKPNLRGPHYHYLGLCSHFSSMA